MDRSTDGSAAILASRSNRMATLKQSFENPSVKCNQENFSNIPIKIPSGSVQKIASIFQTQTGFGSLNSLQINSPTNGAKSPELTKDLITVPLRDKQAIFKVSCLYCICFVWSVTVVVVLLTSLSQHNFFRERGRKGGKLPNLFVTCAVYEVINFPNKMSWAVNYISENNCRLLHHVCVTLSANWISANHRIFFLL